MNLLKYYAWCEDIDKENSFFIHSFMKQSGLIVYVEWTRMYSICLKHFSLYTNNKVKVFYNKKQKNVVRVIITW